MSLSPGEIQYQKDHASDTAVARLVAVFVICFVISYVAISLRFVSRRLNRTKLGTDDWLMLLSGASCLFLEVLLPLSLTFEYIALHDGFSFTERGPDPSWPWTARNPHPKS